jgi:hypothetical protein
VEGKANDFNIGGALAGFGGHFIGGAGLGTFQKTPVEKAIRVAILQAVKELSSKTPQTFFRHGGESKVSTNNVSGARPEGSVTTAKHSENGALKTVSTVASASLLPAAIRVKAASANLRDAAGMNGKVVTTVRAGTKLSVHGEEKDWYFVQAENGKDGWISKSLTESTGVEHGLY